MSPVVQRQKMKRKGRSPAEKQQGSCDVWLDASALKRCKMMNVVRKSALRILGQYSHPAAVYGPHPCTKQTTISTFFTAQKAEVPLQCLNLGNLPILEDELAWRNLGVQVTDRLYMAKGSVQVAVLAKLLRTAVNQTETRVAPAISLDCYIKAVYLISWLTQIPLLLAGEKDVDPNKRLLASASNSTIGLKDHELLRGKRTMAPTSVLQPSGLQDCKPPPAESTSGLRLLPCCSLPARAQSHGGILRGARGEDAVTEGEAFLATDLTQHLEEKGGLEQQMAPMSPLKEKNGWQGEKSPTSFSRGSQGFKIISSQRTNAGKRRRPPSYTDATFVDLCDSENRDPELEEHTPEAAFLTDSNQTASGFCKKHKNTIGSGEKGHENGSLAPTWPLFTQDSEGHKVILHRFWGERGAPPLPEEPRWGPSSTVRSSFCEGCFGDGCSRERSPSGSLGVRRFSLLTDSSEKSCYDLLFTEDSEGNKVIKH
ncbi:uncharacterized protein LOC134503485 [Candoia aspera]|uniref:uncharacterized protein LOC134503485 n=1 Tax=Candoia aspera TaxID=51853 RepID=UPI002FD82B55